MKTQPSAMDQEPPPDPAGNDPAEPSTRELLAYSLPESANVFVNQTSVELMTPLLVTTLGVNPQYVGIILMIRGMWSSVTDPVMGHISDNTRNRFGRRRPYLMLGGVMMAVLLMGLWAFPRGSSEIHVVVHVGICLLLFGTAQTIFSVPYGALAMELSPSYHGRTRVQLVKTYFSRIPGFLGPYLFPFCLLPFFIDALEGIRWLAAITATFILIASSIAFFGTKERAVVNASGEKFWPAVRSTLHSVHFLKIAFIYAALLVMMGAFGSFSYFLVIYYVFHGDVVRGAAYSAYVETFANILLLFGVPLVGWAAKKFQKHNALRAALLLVIFGSALQFLLIDPQRPWLMFIAPLFYSIGLSSTFMILGTMLADVIDADELETGYRRAGLFGAVAAFLMKGAGALAAGASGFLISWTGFQVRLGGDQANGVFHSMLWLYAGKGLLLVACLSVLHRYPLTEQRIATIQAELRARRR